MVSQSTTDFEVLKSFLCLSITFGGRSAHLAYLVHKSGRKTSIIREHSIKMRANQSQPTETDRTTIATSNGRNEVDFFNRIHMYVCL